MFECLNFQSTPFKSHTENQPKSEIDNDDWGHDRRRSSPFRDLGLSKAHNLVAHEHHQLSRHIPRLRQLCHCRIYRYVVFVVYFACALCLWCSVRVFMKMALSRPCETSTREIICTRIDHMMAQSTEMILQNKKMYELLARDESHAAMRRSVVKWIKYVWLSLLPNWIFITC